MPAQVILFDEAESGSIPGRAYLDTSFVRHVLGERRRGLKGSNYLFLQRLLTNRCEAWTSPLLLEEAMWTIFWEGFPKEASARGYSGWSWGDLKRQRPQVFAEVVRALATPARAFLDAFRGLGVQVWLPEGLWPTKKEVFDLQNQLMAFINRFGLEPMDALHLLLAGLGKTHQIVSNDYSFQRVDGITVYASGLAP